MACAYELVGQVSVELVHGLGGLQLALAFGERREEPLELALQRLLLGLQLGLVLPASAVPLHGLLELLQLPSPVTHLVLCHLAQEDRIREER